ncbi:hypothetical protein BST61_g5972 [Cercospora zeina]
MMVMSVVVHPNPETLNSTKQFVRCYQHFMVHFSGSDIYRGLAWWQDSSSSCTINTIGCSGPDVPTRASRSVKETPPEQCHFLSDPSCCLKHKVARYMVPNPSDGASANEKALISDTISSEPRAGTPAAHISAHLTSIHHRTNITGTIRPTQFSHVTTPPSGECASGGSGVVNLISYGA